METVKHRRWGRSLGLMLAIGTLAIYWRVSQFGFVSYDDYEYVKDNPHVQSGVSGENLRWAFTRVHSNNWHPLTWFSHMLDCQFFGANAGAHHLVNVGLHVINTLLLFGLMRRLTGATWRSAVVAGLFALHPAHVESVAWISERKDVLSTLFVLLALRSYARAVRNSELSAESPSAPGGQHLPAMLGFRAYWPGLLCFALSLLSKGMYVTLPFLLLLLDFWPLRRITPESAAAARGKQFVRLATEKWPWLLLSVLASAATFRAQKAGGAVVGVSQYPFPERLANALVAYVRYVGKLFWPTDLTIIYPLPTAWAGWQVAGAAIVLVGLTVAAVLLARKRPYVFVGWAWFVGMLVPVIGLVQVGSQAMADRYTYFSFVGLFVVVVWTVAEFSQRTKQLRLARAGLAVAVLLACAWVTRRQIEYWSSSRALFERAVAVTRDNAQAQFNLGWWFELENRLGEAEKHYAEAVRIQPGNPEFRTSLGVVIARTGNTNAAREQLGRAMDTYLEIIRQRPDYPAGFNGIGIGLSALAEYRDAVNAYGRAVRLRPDDPVYRNNLGVALARTGDLPGAIAAHREVLRIDARHANAASNLGAELVSAGQLDEALPYLELAVRLAPESSEAQSNLGGALARKGDHLSAIHHYETALQQDPLQAKTHLNLGISLNKVGRLAEAIAHLAEAARLDPGNLDAQYNLGRSYFLQGNASLAVAHLEIVLQAAPDHAFAHYYLGQACATLRQMDSALAHLRAAIRLHANWPEALTALAWILAADRDGQYRNGAEAIALVEPVATVSDARQPMLLDVLAAAFAETGRFEDAITTAQQALASARQLGQTNLTGEITQRLQLYTAHQPFRSTLTAQ